MTRIFSVQIKPEPWEGFEQQFASIPVEAFESKTGFVEVSIGKPTQWAPHEYVMISKWQNEVLVNFAGPNGQQAIIPEGMEKFLVQCRVRHHEAW